jgi:hypothetical protein
MILMLATSVKAPSVRKKRRQPEQSSTTSTSSAQANLPIKSVPTPAISPKASLPLSPAVPTEIPQPTKQEASGASEPSLIQLFSAKLAASSEFTEKFMEMMFNQVANVEDPTDPIIKAQLNGLCYPIHKHLREIVSSFNDMNSFLNGELFAFFDHYNNTPSIKQHEGLFTKNLYGLAGTLREFKIYHLDQAVEEEIDTVLQKVDTGCKQLVSAAADQPELQSLATALTTLIKGNYIAPLDALASELAQNDIATLLPAREKQSTFVKRAIKKKTSWIVTFASFKIWQEIKKQANGMGGALLNKAIGTATSYAPETAQKISNIAQSTFFSTPAKPVKQPSLAAGIDSLASRAESLATSAASTLGSLKNSPIQTIGSTVSAIPGGLWSGTKWAGKQIGIEVLGGAINTADQELSYYIKKLPYNTLLSIASYFPTWEKEKPFALGMRTLNNLNQETLYRATNFICAYIDTLFAGIIRKTQNNHTPALIKEVAQSLQVLQIEIFRHRRFVASELTNAKAFTQMYLYYLHHQYIGEHNGPLQEAYLDEFIETNKDIFASIPPEEHHAAIAGNKEIAELYNGYIHDQQYIKPIFDDETLVAFKVNNQAGQELVDQLEGYSHYSLTAERTLIQEINNAFGSMLQNLEQLEELKGKATNDTQKQLLQKANDLFRSKQMFTTLCGLIKANRSDSMVRKLKQTIQNLSAEIVSFGARTKAQVMKSITQTNIDQQYASKLTGHLDDLEEDLEEMMADAYHTLPLRMPDSKDPLGLIVAYKDYQYKDSTPITIPYPRLSPDAAEAIDTLLRDMYIQPLRLLVDHTKKSSPLWDILPKGQTKFVAVPLKAITIGGKAVGALMSAVLYAVPLSTLWYTIPRVYLAVQTGGLSELAYQLSYYSLSKISSYFLGGKKGGDPLLSGAWSVATKGLEATVESGIARARKAINPVHKAIKRTLRN